MKNNETGEFELVLGNKQLLSGFFIVVILFGVFFTMGYIVGRNSAPSPRIPGAAEAASGQPPAAPADARPQQASGATAPPPADAVQAAPGSQPGESPAQAAPQPTTQPANEPGAEPPKAAEMANLPSGLVEPAPGDVYLQVMAVKRPEAEVVVKTLRDKSFRAVMAQGPNELVRVLVGPFPDTASLGQAKAGLENAGFHSFVKK